jgi:hypothetical protein
MHDTAFRLEITTHGLVVTCAAIASGAGSCHDAAIDKVNYLLAQSYLF